MTRADAVVRTMGRVRERVRRLDSTVGAPLSVLAYHRVATPPLDPWNLAVSPANFTDQVALMQRVGRVVPLEEALGRRLWRDGRRRCFAITFDDGYVDNLDTAVTVLERHG